jgi:glutamate N-acetyltransferase/amino-acid N-acetyltransferase
MIEVIKDGSVSSPEGFLAGGTYSGIKAVDGVLDLGILISEHPAVATATFTTNQVVSPSVTLSKERVADGKARGVIVNSGCANCCVGSQGYIDAEEMISLAARHLNLKEEEFLVCSTGVIGVELPMALIRQNIGNLNVTKSGGHDFARAIMTTDSHQKEIAVSVDLGGKTVTIGGAAKGVGMIHPSMATMLCFITTDANIGHPLLDTFLKQSVDLTFNMIDVDGDQSTNDTVMVLANGMAEGEVIKEGTAAAKEFCEALQFVCESLAKALIKDGEGSERIIEVLVEGAVDNKDARIAARSIASSILVKSMVHGRDPNWGRIMMALGKSGVEMEESKVDIYINEIHVVHDGVAISYLKDAVISVMSGEDIYFRVDLNCGNFEATAWGCDLTEDYVVINSAYTT